MSIKKSNTIKSYEITSESIYLERRKLIKSMSVASAMLPWGMTLSQSTKDDSYIPTYKRNSIYSTLEPKNSFEDITTYNNFYEFGMGKSDPYQNSANFEPAPWNVKISGEANKTGIYNIDDLIDSNALEERVYRLRCV